MSKPKRKADIQLTKDDREADDSDEVIVDGAVPKASKEELSKRRIVRAKRPAAAAATVADPKEEAKEETKKASSGGAFANVSLTSSSSSTGVFGASSAFAGFGAAVAKEGEKSVFGAAATGFKGFGTTTANAKDGDAAKGASPPAPTFGGFASFTSSSSNAKPFVFGQAPSDTSKAASGKPAVELPQDYKVQSGEESEICLHEVRCKSYRWGVPTVTAAASDVAAEKAPPSVPHATTFAKDDGKSTETAETKGSKEDEKEPTPKETANGDTKNDTKPEDQGETNETAETAATAASTTEASTASPKALPAQWIETGVGPLRVLVSSNEQDRPHSFGRLVQRRQPDAKEKPTKVICNLQLGQESVVKLVGDKHVQISSPVAGQCLFKLGTAAKAKDLHQQAEQVAKTSKSFLATASDKDDDGN